jgi:hypothetical protein
MALPGLRWNTCGVGASVMKIDLPSALWPVTTRRGTIGMMTPGMRRDEQ